jgi:hypothetical protein
MFPSQNERVRVRRRSHRVAPGHIGLPATNGQCATLSYSCTWCMWPPWPCHAVLLHRLRSPSAASHWVADRCMSPPPLRPCRAHATTYCAATSWSHLQGTLAYLRSSPLLTRVHRAPPRPPLPPPPSSLLRSTRCRPSTRSSSPHTPRAYPPICFPGGAACSPEHELQ